MPGPTKRKSTPQQKKFFFLPVQNFTEELGERISIARRRRRLTQGQLAQKSQTSLATYKRIERGDMSVAIGTILSVLYCLDDLQSCEALLKADLKALESARSGRLPKRIRQKRTAQKIPAPDPNGAPAKPSAAKTKRRRTAASASAKKTAA